MDSKPVRSTTPHRIAVFYPCVIVHFLPNGATGNCSKVTVVFGSPSPLSCVLCQVTHGLGVHRLSASSNVRTYVCSNLIWLTLVLDALINRQPADLTSPPVGGENAL